MSLNWLFNWLEDSYLYLLVYIVLKHMFQISNFEFQVSSFKFQRTYNFRWNPNHAYADTW